MASFSSPHPAHLLKRGFGLVQVLVAISLMSFLMVALSSIMNQMNASGGAVREKMEFLETAAAVSSLLKDKGACTEDTFLDQDGKPATQPSGIKKLYSKRFEQVIVPNSFVTEVVVEGSGSGSGFLILLKAKKPLSGPQLKDFGPIQVTIALVDGKYKCDFPFEGGSGPTPLVKDFRNETICANGSGAYPDPNDPQRSSQVVWRLRGVKQDGTVEYNASLGGESTTRSAILRVSAYDGVIVPNSFESNQTDILQPPPSCQFKIQ